MTFLHRIICWLRRGHTDARLMAITKTVDGNEERWVCRDCLAVWTEYNYTGTHGKERK